MNSASLERRSTGCDHIYPSAVSSLRSAVIDHRRFRVVQAFHKALSSDRSFSRSTCRRSRTSLLNMESGSTNLLTTCKFTSHSDQGTEIWARSRAAPMTFERGTYKTIWLLNPDKSEVFVFGTSASLRAAELTSVKICGVELPVALNIKSLGVVLDSRLTFEKQVQSICKSCNYHLWALRHIRHLVPQDVAHTLACSIVMSRMDYCNSLLIGAPEYVISRLQRVQNNLARIVTGSSHQTHAAPLLFALHWLPIRHRMEYKLALITYKVRATSNPGYLNDLFVPAARTGYSLRSSSRPLLIVPRTKTVTASRGFLLCCRYCLEQTAWLCD